MTAEEPGLHSLEVEEDAIAKVLASWDEVVQTSARLAKRTARTQGHQRVGMIVVILVAIAFIRVAQVSEGASNTASHRATKAYTQATANHDSLYNTCVSGNEYREADLKRWNIFINIIVPPGQPESPQVQQEVAEQRAANAQADKLRDCKKIK